MVKARMMAAVAAVALARAAAAQDAPAEALMQPQDGLAAAAPVSVSAFGIADLTDLGIDTPFALARTVPDMIAAHPPGLGSANAYYIRGVGTTETLGTSDAPVASVVDGVVLPRLAANDFGLFDVERIEVRRGPQSILLGHDAIGGAVDVRLRAPADRIAGYVEGGYGAFAEKAFRASLDVPVTPAFAVKLSGYYADDHGVARNTTTGERTNATKRAGLRGAFRAQPSERLSWNAAFAYMRNDGVNLPSFDCDPAAPDSCKGRFAATGLRRDDAASPFVALGVGGRKAGFGLQNQADTRLLTSTLAWAGDAVTVSAISGIVATRQHYAVDLAAATTPSTFGYAQLNDARDIAYSQELRLAGALFGGGIDYAVGGSYRRERDREDLADVVGGAAPRLVADRTLRRRTEAWAGYAQVDGHLSPALTVSGGVRYTDETDRLRVGDNRAQCATALLCFEDATLDALGIARSRHDRLWTPRGAVDLQLAGVTLYASATRGTRSGGWNGRATTPADLVALAPEKAWSYEAGARSELFDKRLRLSLTGFYVDTKRAQVFADAVDPVTGLPGFTAGIDAGSRNYGAEAEAAVAPVKGLRLYANAGYQHARYRPGDAVRSQQAACLAAPAGGDCGRGIVTADGGIARPVRAPDLTLAAGGTYDYAIPSAGILVRPSLNAVYRTRFATDPAALLTARAHVEVDAVLAMLTDDGNWIVSVECGNCLDATATDASLIGYAYLNPPRTWRVRARRTF